MRGISIRPPLEGKHILFQVTSFAADNITDVRFEKNTFLLFSPALQIQGPFSYFKVFPFLWEPWIPAWHFLYSKLGAIQMP